MNLLGNPRYLLLTSGLAERDISYVFIMGLAVASIISVLVMYLLSRWTRLPRKWRAFFGLMENFIQAYNLLAFLTLAVLSYLFTA